MSAAGSSVQWVVLPPHTSVRLASFTTYLYCHNTLLDDLGWLFRALCTWRKRYILIFDTGVDILLVNDPGHLMSCKT